MLNYMTKRAARNLFLSFLHFTFYIYFNFCRLILHDPWSVRIVGSMSFVPRLALNSVLTWRERGETAGDGRRHHSDWCTGPTSGEVVLTSVIGVIVPAWIDRIRKVCSADFMIVVCDLCGTLGAPTPQTVPVVEGEGETTCFTKHIGIFLFSFDFDLM